MTNALTESKAVIQYALKSDYDKNGNSSFKSVEGTSELNTYAGSKEADENKAVYINNVLLNGLAEGQEYAYRVGNGTDWSDVSSFKTNHKNSDTNFLILGDVQTVDFDGFKKDLASIGKNSTIDYDFTI